MGLSRFLNINNLLKFLLIIVLSYFALVTINVFLYIFIVLIIVLFVILNRTVLTKSRQQIPDLFNLDCRNFDVIIIGDLCDYSKIVPQNMKVLTICAPGRTLYACELILKRIHSLLRENKGSVIFVVDKTNVDSCAISFFDIPFLHIVTLRDLKLMSNYRKLQNKYPLIFHFKNSIKWLLNQRITEYVEFFEERESLTKFCTERNIKFSIYINK